MHRLLWVFLHDFALNSLVFLQQYFSKFVFVHPCSIIQKETVLEVLAEFSIIMSFLLLNTILLCSDFFHYAQQMAIAVLVSRLTIQAICWLSLSTLLIIGAVFCVDRAIFQTQSTNSSKKLSLLWIIRTLKSSLLIQKKCENNTKFYATFLIIILKFLQCQIFWSF